MILTIAPKGIKLKIVNISGKESQQKQLSDLGLLINAEIIFLEEAHGNIVVNINDRKVVIGKELANRIKVVIS